ncbi:MAG: hypothetical protein A3D92_01595 [Bacteroidetes bacterium RIFCSPHIGHO2_02_FULL_44_7]|nr:MAG: hypothetical protein A3D92_01595 [Bacteroidetes bacterium RIFCSPHIGHO2_02_FULL_44_7]
MRYCAHKHPPKKLTTYILLQYKRFCRISFQKGIHPILAASLIAIAFLSVTYVIFLKVRYPAYVYALVGIVASVYLSNGQRSEFLRQCFKTKNYLLIRLLENGSLALPFAAVLIFQGAYLTATLFFVTVLALASLPIQTKISLNLPTPFGRFPFEFTRGFRRYLLLYLLTYLLAYFGIQSNNFNLTGLLFLSTFLISATYFSIAEPVYYVWIYNRGPRHFLYYKLRMILLYSILPGLPLALSLFVFFPTMYWLTLIALLTGVSYIIIFMLAKYASYPYEMSITDGFIVAVCIFFPPFILLALPYFYIRSIKTLSKILHD